MAGDADEPTHPRAPGWYDDPFSATGTGERYWDGKKWGSSERPLGRHSVAQVESEPRKQRRMRSVSGSDSPSGPSSPGRNRQIAVFVGFIAVVLIAAWGIPQLTGSNDDDGDLKTSGTTQIGPADDVNDVPPAGTGEAAKPLGTPAAVPAGNGKYEFANLQDDDKTPVAFDPCRTIHYVINPQGAPAGGVAGVKEAIARLSTATGLQFVDEGTTTEQPVKQRKLYQPDRYDKNRWAPVLIAWSNESAFPDLAGSVAGVTRPGPVYAENREIVLVSGQLVLDSVIAHPDPETRNGIALHELGHLVGLDHTSDRSQLMFTETVPGVNDFGNGDRRGLSILGTQQCYPSV